MPINFAKSSADWLVCKCGNEPDLDGFYPCLPSGELVEPVLGGAWQDDLYRCDRCYSIYSLSTFEQHGVADEAFRHRT